MIIITDELLADIEAKANAATQDSWVVVDEDELLVGSSCRDIATTAIGPLPPDETKWDEIAANCRHIARMDPPTTLALVSAHRSALARIAELEAALALAVTAGKARIRVEQNNAQEIRDAAITDSQESAKEARRAALEDALGRIAQERYADTEDAPDNDYHDGMRKGYDRSMQAVRSLLYVREIPGESS